MSPAWYNWGARLSSWRQESKQLIPLNSTLGFENVFWTFWLTLTYGLGNDDVVFAFRQPKLWTVFLHCVRSQVRWDACSMDIFMFSQSSRILSGLLWQKATTSITCAARLSWLQPIFTPTFLWSAILFSKVGQTDLVCGVRCWLTSKSVHEKLQVYVCSGYDLSHCGWPRVGFLHFDHVTFSTHLPDCVYCVSFQRLSRWSCR